MPLSICLPSFRGKPCVFALIGTLPCVKASLFPSVICVTASDRATLSVPAHFQESDMTDPKSNDIAGDSVAAIAVYDTTDDTKPITDGIDT